MEGGAFYESCGASMTLAGTANSVYSEVMDYGSLVIGQIK